MKRKNLLFSVAMFATISLSAVNPATTWSVIADTSNGLPSTASGRLIWGDVDNDGYKDAFIVSGQGGGQAGMFKNNGNGTFTKIHEGTFTGLSKSSAVFIDYDNDGDLDLIITGKTNENQDAIFVYDNTGEAGSYTFVHNETRSSELYGPYSGDNDSPGRLINAVDYDNDGWVDILVCGATDNHYDWITEKDPKGWDWRWRFTALYKNNAGSFQRKTDIVDGGDFVHTSKGSIHVGDVNGDGYADILAQGYSDFNIAWNAKLYINNQDGTFSISPYSSELNGNENYESVFVDVNGDGYSDIVEISRAVGNVHISDGAGSFTKHSTTGLMNAYGASITAGDINNDGFVDLLVSGQPGNDGLFTNSTKIFYSNGDNTFNDVGVDVSMQARSGSVALVDIDGDGNLDFSNFGYGQGWTTAFAKNTLASGTIAGNTAPSVPTDFEVQYVDGKFSFSWTASTDLETPTSAIRYNIYAKNTNDNTIYAYAPVDTITGKLKIGGSIVPLIGKNSFELNLPKEDYVFGVQAIDQADVSSEFVKYNYLKVTTKTHSHRVDVSVFSNEKSVRIQNNTSSALRYSIITLSGKTIEEGVCNAGSQKESSILNQGIYFVKFHHNDLVYSRKVAVL